MLVLEAMPLQQFPGPCGKFLGINPPFTHPQCYPTQAWVLGRLMLHLQLTVLRNSMERMGIAPSNYFKAMISCGRWACARFCPGAGPTAAHVQPAMLGYLCKGTTGTTPQMPCFVTRHPAALAWHGLEAAEHLVLAFVQANCIASNEPVTQILTPAFTRDSMPNLLKRLQGPLPRLLVGDVGLATIYNGRYLGLSVAFVNSKLGLSCLPSKAKVMVGKVGCPTHVPITMSETSSKSGQIHLRVLGLQQLLLLLHLSSKQAVVQLLPDHTLLVCFSPLLEHPCTSEELQQKHEEAAQKALVRLDLLRPCCC